MEKGEYHYHQQVHYSPCGGGERGGIERDNGEEKRPSADGADFGAAPNKTTNAYRRTVA